jgi:hypothetical protein
MLKVELTSGIANSGFQSGITTLSGSKSSLNLLHEIAVTTNKSKMTGKKIIRPLGNKRVFCLFFIKQIFQIALAK